MVSDTAKTAVGPDQAPGPEAQPPGTSAGEVMGRSVLANEAEARVAAIIEQADQSGHLAPAERSVVLENAHRSLVALLGSDDR